MGETKGCGDVKEIRKEDTDEFMPKNISKDGHTSTQVSVQRCPFFGSFTSLILAYL